MVSLGQIELTPKLSFQKLEAKLSVTCSLRILRHHPCNLNARFHLSIFGSHQIALTQALQKWNAAVTDLGGTAAGAPVLDDGKSLLHHTHLVCAPFSSLHHIHSSFGKLCGFLLPYSHEWQQAFLRCLQQVLELPFFSQPCG